ncbi:MAG: hypothetical protein HY744_27985 [Deltaproteobacteria bacterium]|nr:hypothetical protein [Deltaproteobacteria bacterium]
MLCRARLVLFASLLATAGGAAVACNVLWGLDELDYRHQAAEAGVAGGGGASVAAGGGGGAGAGGSGGIGGAPSAEQICAAQCPALAKCFSAVPEICEPTCREMLDGCKPDSLVKAAQCGKLLGACERVPYGQCLADLACVAVPALTDFCSASCADLAKCTDAAVDQCEHDCNVSLIECSTGELLLGDLCRRHLALGCSVLPAVQQCIGELPCMAIPSLAAVCARRCELLEQCSPQKPPQSCPDECVLALAKCTEPELVELDACFYLNMKACTFLGYLECVAEVAPCVPASDSGMQAD